MRFVILAFLLSFLLTSAFAAQKTNSPTSSLELVTANRNITVTGTNCQGGYTHGIPNSTIDYSIGRLASYVYANKDVCDEITNKLEISKGTLKVTLFDAGGVIVGYGLVTSEDENRDYPVERTFFSKEWIKDAARSQVKK